MHTCVCVCLHYSSLLSSPCLMTLVNALNVFFSCADAGASSARRHASVNLIFVFFIPIIKNNILHTKLIAEKQTNTETDTQRQSEGPATAASHCH